MTDPIPTILLCAIATYLTRTTGHLVLSRFGRLHHRLEAALNSVPPAVLTALVAPYAATNGLVEAIAVLVAAVVSWRFSLLQGVIAGLILLGIARNFL